MLPATQSTEGAAWRIRGTRAGAPPTHMACASPQTSHVRPARGDHGILSGALGDRRACLDDDQGEAEQGWAGQVDIVHL